MKKLCFSSKILGGTFPHLFIVFTRRPVRDAIFITADFNRRVARRGVFLCLGETTSCTAYVVSPRQRERGYQTIRRLKSAAINITSLTGRQVSDLRKPCFLSKILRGYFPSFIHRFYAPSR